MTLQLLQDLGLASEYLKLTLVEFGLGDHFYGRLLLCFRIVVHPCELVHRRQVVQTVDEQHDAELALT